MKKINFSGENFSYLLLFLFVVANCIIQCAMFDSNFFTLYDEAYCLLKCRDAYDGIITGKSQWDLLAVNWFPYFDLTNKVYASWASVILIAATILNTLIAFRLITQRWSFFKCCSLLLLLLFPVIGGEYASDIQTRVGWVTGVNYLVIQVFLLESAISVFLIYYYNKKSTIKTIALVICGILSGISLFVIIPSGVLVILCMGGLIIFKQEDWTNKIYGYLWLLLGICIAMIYIHLFISPLPSIIKEMLFTASYVEKSGFGYTPIDFLRNIGSVILDFLGYIPLLFGIWYISTKVNFKIKQIEYLSYIVYIWLFVIWIYRDSLVYRSFMPTIPFLACSTCMIMCSIFHANDILNIRKNIPYLFLFVMPLVCAIGTNTNLWGRIGCFIVPWGILIVMSEDFLQIHIDKKVIVGFIVLLLIPLSINTSRIVYHSKKYYTEHFVSGNQNVAGIAMTVEQKKYFEKIQNIIEKYDYQPRKSVFFASYLDYCTIYALDAELSSKFHLPCNFPFFPKEQMLQPDFIILIPEESHIYKLEELKWGWPEEYDVFEIGTPETIHQKLIGDVAKKRLLYCRKSLKRQQ